MAVFGTGMEEASMKISYVEIFLFWDNMKLHVLFGNWKILKKIFEIHLKTIGGQMIIIKKFHEIIFASTVFSVLVAAEE